MIFLIVTVVLLNILCEVGFQRATKSNLMGFVFGIFMGCSLLLDKELRQVIYIGFSDDVYKTWKEVIEEELNVQK